MVKVAKFAKLLTKIGFLSILVGCASTKVVAPTASFVRLTAKHQILICATENTKKDIRWQQAEMPECISVSAGSTASGSVIDHYRDPQTNEERSLILSVAHWCELSINQKIDMLPAESGIKTLVKTGHYEIKDHHIAAAFLTTSNKEEFKIIKKISSESSVDVCLLESERLNTPKLQILNQNPEYGERVLNMAAPWGYFNPPNIFIDEGLYLGECVNPGVCSKFGAFSISGVYAGSGSSGSPILVKRHGRWYIAGIIHTVRISPFGGTYLPMGATVEQIKAVIQRDFIPYKKGNRETISPPKENSMK